VDDDSSVVRLKQMFGTQAIEHGSSRSGRWLRERRVRITLAIATIEGLLYLVHALHWWVVVALAAIAILFWAYAGRSSRSYTLRQASWVFAVSQVLVLLVPLAFWILKAIAIGVVVLLAIAALVVLITRRP
jgi:hypothetical protein